MNKRLLATILGIIVGIGVGVILYQKSTSPKLDNTKLTTLRLPISGVTSQTDVTKVVKTLQKLPGVGDVQIDMNSKILICQYDTAQISPKKIAEKINASGFKTQVPGDGKLQVLDYKINFN